MQATDQLTVLLLSVAVPAIVSVIISLFVARRYGAMPAAKYTQKATQRSEHHRSIVSQQLGHHLKEILAVSRIDNIPTVSLGRTGKIEITKIDLYERNSPEFEFLVSHLQTGYKELHKKILSYIEGYNAYAEAA